MWVGNNWAGTASIVDAKHAQGAQARREPGPRQGPGARRHPRRPREAGVLHRDPAGAGRGSRPVRRRHVHHQGRKYLAVSRPSFADVVWIDVAKAVAGRADSIVREQPMDGHRTDHMGVSPDGRRLLVSDSTERQVIEFSMVDETVDGKKIAMGDRTAHLRVGRDAAREQLHQGRLADLPREHRQGLHAGRRERLRPGEDRSAARRPQGRPLVPDRAQLRLQDHPALGHGQGARRGGLPRHELGGAPDGDRAGRALRLLPGLLLPRARRVRHPGQGHQRHWSTTPPARSRSRGRAPYAAW